jgi:cyclophilin family peptidyl-prolyl cis-trans isomerase
VTNIIADNRGEVIFQMDQPLDPSTVNGTSVQMHTAGKDGKFGTADDVKIGGHVRYFVGNKRVTFRTSNLPVNTTYSMKLNSKRMLSADGIKLDGEYNGGKTTGNGIGGGDTLVICKKYSSTSGINPVARFTLAAGGAFNVQLFADKTPKNAANFIAYANGAAYDSAIVHRSLPGFVAQGGGFVVNKKDQLVTIPSNAPVDNEPHITSNVRGTIALARPDDNNAATDDKGTNQFFFNLADNSTNLDNQNGGFTAFGAVTDSNGLAVMDSIAAFPTVNAGGAFTDLPVLNSSITASAAASDPANSLVLFRRVAIVDKIVPFA